MAPPFEITLRNMRFNVCVGILAHEQEHAQPLEIDLTVWARAATPGSMAIDYRELYAMVNSAVNTPPIALLEVIAERVIQGAMELATVSGVRVALRKPHVALGGPLDYAEVAREVGVRA
jgi:dihydroneopterin aldolase